MKTIFKYFQLVFLFAWMAEGYADDIIPTYPSQASCTVSETEKQALLDFYTATDGANWKNTRANNKAWKSDIPICDWHGVTVANGHVTRINLPNNNLNGEVPSSISNLTKLSYLALNTNRVSKLPETIGNLSELRTLALVRNNLTTLPNGIVNLPRIESLIFSTNGLSSLPAGINKLTTLKGLNLTQNKFSGNIPEEIFELVNLQTLTMRQNKLSGVISPKIGALKRLNHIDIGFNNFTGAIPKEIQNLTLLTTLKMDNNALVAIPDEIQALKAMITLELSKNQIKAIPNGITRLPRLKLLYLSNNKIQGSIPKDFVNNTALVGIYLSFNELSGTIPLELGNMPSLKTLTVDNNQLTGTVPESLAAKLSGFNFHENKLEGSIPYFTKSDLRSFSFYGNKFVFSDFENNHVSYKNRARNNYRYAPQAKVDQPASKTIDAGQTITLSSTALTSPNNSYQWYKTVGGTTTAITGATNKELTITNASAADAGVYHFVATNSVVTDLTLERHPITVSIAGDTCGVSEAEKQALLDFYAATGGANWKNTVENNKPWDPATPVCDWYGVTVVNGKVYKVVLGNNNLVGTISNSITNLTGLDALELFGNSLSGAIPGNINLLSNLKTLRLEQNQISGTIPAQIGSLSNMRYLHLGFNRLTGTIPPALGQLSKVQLFSAASNKLTGSIPPQLKGMTSIRDLNFSNNQMTGAIPVEMAEMSTLRYLSLAWNDFTGTIPTQLGQLGQLGFLSLERNRFTGSIPKELANATSLYFLNLSRNQFTGTIPKELGNLSALKQFSVSYNRLTGNIPNEIRNLAELERLFLSNNEFEGSVPDFSGLSKLYFLTIKENHLVFKDFENEHPSYTALQSYAYAPQAKVDQPETRSINAGQSITLTSTALTSPNNSYQWYKTVGGTTTAITGATNKNLVISNASTADAGVYHFLATNSIVTDLTLERHPITLTVIEDTCGVSEVEKQALLDFYTATGGPNWKNTVENNKPWDPAIPVCDWYGVIVNNGTVTGLNLGRNNLSGNLVLAPLASLPELSHLSLGINNLSGEIPMSVENLFKLSYINLESNKLTGSIPEVLADLKKLSFISFAKNQLTGEILPELSALPNLKNLYLNNNQLTGGIPNDLGIITNLEYLDISFNKLSGSIPSSLGQLTKLKWLAVNNNQLEGVLPATLGQLVNLNRLYASNNQLSGELPVALGTLTALNILDLANNKLSGSIPGSLGNLTNLTNVYLNKNELSGNLPEELTRLTRLKQLFLHDNKLSGKIPAGFTNISFVKLFFNTNQFVFSDFESEYTTYKQRIQFFEYAPQAKVDQPENHTIQLGGEIILTTTALTSPNNSYQWYKTVGGTTTAITGATDKELTISNADMTDAGVYHFLATNSIVDGLTLERHPITLIVKEPQDCSALTCEEVIVDALNFVKNNNGITNTQVPFVLTDVPSFFDTCIDEFFKIGQEDTLVWENINGLNYSFVLRLNDAIIFKVDSSSPAMYSESIVSFSAINVANTYEEIVFINTDGVETIMRTKGFEINCNPCTDCPVGFDLCLGGNTEEYPIVYNLIPHGDHINWYLTETGGTPLEDNTPISTEAENPGGVIYWWDDTTDGSDTRTPQVVTVSTNLPEVEEFQIFSAGMQATIGDLQATGNNIEWYLHPAEGNPLPADTPLEHLQSYFAQGPDATCRAAVVVMLQTDTPQGDGYQTLCKGATLADIVLQVAAGSSIKWYNQRTGGQLLPATTALVHGVTYYATQLDQYGGESEERKEVTVNIIEVFPPYVPSTEQVFYANQSHTIANLLAIGNGIRWYDQEEGGIAYAPTETLVDGQYYYAAQQSEAGCTGDRQAVLVRILAEEAPTLFGCEKFKPRIGDRYVVNAWVREQGVTPVNPDIRAFNDSEISQLFVELLNHLKDKVLSADSDIYHIPAIYIPHSETANLNFDPIVSYIKDTEIDERKLTVYNFSLEKDTYGRTIGFSFFLNKNQTAKIMYQSPKVRKRGTLGGVSILDYRYPIRDNADNIRIDFTDVKVVNDQLQLISDFEMNNAGSYSTSLTNHTDVVSGVSPVEETVTFYEYEEIPGYQPITYMNALVEIQYKDANETVMEADKLVFIPKGPVIDGWQQVSGTFVIPVAAHQMTMSLKNIASDINVYFDDIRFHPYDSSMKTFVYDPITQRLMSELDENNFATFYEYDAEGGLIRVKKETAKGIFTIQESRSGNVKATD
ncbi:hypothetical protein HN014_09900 [Aquimarina sp. TRL1]|uniref:leucine-rich repeat domain-containing protein n=1 Tax=Aquimarina sp. (strain TRL1) TaxID=2736252 RepID=UPI00158D2127|nr:leucine-rich repeat domain-containing protein [Aquimarina sp. TRL1]QKX05217.1 hypothetical protein HN014_09900 [Aquimarina sp. TRL1]